MTDVSIEPGMIGSLIFLGMIGLFISIGIIWVFVDANKPRNKKIMNEKVPTWIEISWLIPAVFIAIFVVINGVQFLFIPLFFALIFVRLYLVRLYELINPDWETDGTSTGIPTLEKVVDTLDEIPSPSELEYRAAEIIANEIIEEFRDEDSLLRQALRAWPIGPIIEFHKRNHKKKWFVFYVYFIAIFIFIPLAIVLMILEDIVRGAL